MEIALIGEGTYPYQFGGVSVWCDQLVRGMPDYDFKVVALVSTGSEPVRFELPDNVASVLAVPLWGPPPRAARPRRNARSSFRPLLVRLIDVLLSPPEDEQAAFADIMREIFEYAQHDNLGAVLATEDAVAVLSDAWRARWAGSEVPAPTVHDAMASIQILEHSLRPLSHPPVRADIAHAVTNGLGALPALASKWAFETPVLVTEHGVALREQYLHHRQSPFAWPTKAFFLTFLRRLCTLCYHEAATIAPGNIYNTRWEEQLGADSSRVRTVYNGVEPSEFPTVAAEPDVPTIAWAGRIDPFKDLETLLRAFATVLLELPNARLRIFGSTPTGRESYLQRCQALVAELDMTDAVAFEGRVDEIGDAYAAGSIVVLCSITEGFPYTLIEAMTCGRPCVGTDVGGVAEAIGDTGIVVPPRTPDALAEACITLLSNDDLRRRLGIEARSRALEYFTVDRAISAYNEIYTFMATGHQLPIAGTDFEIDVVDTDSDSDTASRARSQREAAPGPPTLTLVPALVTAPTDVPDTAAPAPNPFAAVVLMAQSARQAAEAEDWGEAARIALVVSEVVQAMSAAAAARRMSRQLAIDADAAAQAALDAIHHEAETTAHREETAQLAQHAAEAAEYVVHAAADAKVQGHHATREAEEASEAARDALHQAARAGERAHALEEVVTEARRSEHPDAWAYALAQAQTQDPRLDLEPAAPVSLDAAG